MKHIFKTNDYDTEIDMFAYNIGHHNGPECILCGKSLCQHCSPLFLTEDCKAGIETIKFALAEKITQQSKLLHEINLIEQRLKELTGEKQ